MRLTNYRTIFSIAILAACVLCVSAQARMVMVVGGGQPAAAAPSLCSASYTFCSGWESGSDNINTGAVSPEAAFTSATGTPTQGTVATLEGAKALQFSSGSPAYVTKSGFSAATADLGVIFRVVSGEWTGNFVFFELRDTNDDCLFSLRIRQNADGATQPMYFQAFANIAGWDQVGSDIELPTPRGATYEVIVSWSKQSAGNSVSVKLYNSSGAQVGTTQSGTNPRDMNIVSIKAGSTVDTAVSGYVDGVRMYAGGTVTKFF